LLCDDNIVRGIDGDYWIFTKREKNDHAVKVPLLDKAPDIWKKYDQSSEIKHEKLQPVLSNQKNQ